MQRTSSSLNRDKQKRPPQTAKDFVWQPVPAVRRRLHCCADIYPEDVCEHLKGSVYAWKLSLLISGLNLTSCGDKKPSPSKSQISYFLPSWFFFFFSSPQTIWHSQPALASCWKQMYFGLEQAPLQQAGDGHHSVFCKWLCSWKPSLCHRTLPCAPAVWVPARLQRFEAGGGEEGLHEEEETEWRAGGLVAGARGFAIRSSGVCHFDPFPSPSAFTKKKDPSQEGERAFYKYNYETVGINTTRQMDSSAETDRLDGEIK